MNGTVFRHLPGALAALTLVLAFAGAPASAQPGTAQLSAGGLVPQTALSPTDRNQCFAACLADGHGWRLCKAVCYGTGAKL